MAIYTVSVGYEAEGSGSWLVNTSADLRFLERGDYVRFQRYSGTSGTITVTGLGSNWVGSPSSVSIPTSSTSYVQVQVTSTATDGYTNSFRFNLSGASQETLAYKISIPDTTPNSFSLPNKTGLNPKTDVRIGSIDLSGFNRALVINFTTVSGTPINVRSVVSWAGNVRTSTGVEAGERVTVYAEAPTGYNQSYRSRMTIGGTYTDFTVATLAQPYLDETIPFGHATGPVSLKADVAAFFGGEGSASLSEYYKYPGGLHVPSISQNSAIPTSGTISLSNFRNSYTAFYFIKSPIGKSKTINTQGAGRSLILDWNKVTDWEIGWGDRLELTSSYRYEFLRDDNEPLADVTFTLAAGQSEASFSTGNTFARISASVSANTEKIYHGRLRIHAKNSVSTTTYIIIREIDWMLVFYGP